MFHFNQWMAQHHRHKKFHVIINIIQKCKLISFINELNLVLFILDFLRNWKESKYSENTTNFCKFYIYNNIILFYI
jgi:hypothetical protein